MDGIDRSTNNYFPTVNASPVDVPPVENSNHSRFSCLSCSNLSVQTKSTIAAVALIVIVVASLALSGHWVAAIVVGGIFALSGAATYGLYRCVPEYREAMDHMFREIERKARQRALEAQDHNREI